MTTTNRPDPIAYDDLPTPAADAIDSLLAELDLIADESESATAFFDAMTAANIDLETASRTLMQMILDNFSD